jgi:hypothetical protein
MHTHVCMHAHHLIERTCTSTRATLGIKQAKQSNHSKQGTEAHAVIREHTQEGHGRAPRNAQSMSAEMCVPFTDLLLISGTQKACRLENSARKASKSQQTKHGSTREHLGAHAGADMGHWSTGGHGRTSRKTNTFVRGNLCTCTSP